MSSGFQPRKPRFKLGHRVVAIAPGMYRNRKAIVMEIINPSAGDVSVFAQPDGDVPHLRKGVPMPPAPLDAKPLPLDSTQDRREYFADWLTSPDNPYFARALVNRVWRNFMEIGRAHV